MRMELRVNRKNKREAIRWVWDNLDSFMELQKEAKITIEIGGKG